ADHTQAFSCIIDTRSEDEYALDHLPGALNWPSLTNAERICVGTLYKQVNAFEANKVGAALVAANIAKHLEREVKTMPKGWQPLLYCWRGGKRSGSLGLVLGQIGFKVWLIQGGYKAFRAEVLNDIAHLSPRLRFQVVAGPTGSGKTRLLHALKAQGAQVLDLEALAHHRSSVLGRIPGQAQPSQKHFDMRVWDQLRQFDPKRSVFVEAESKKVGNVSIQAELLQAIRSSHCIDLRLSQPERVALLLEDYSYFSNNPELFCQRLSVLVAQKGKAVIGQWQQQVCAGQTPLVVSALLEQHYDPAYAKSVERNFSRFEQAHVATLPDRHLDSMTKVASELAKRFP
ncbi:MAG: tRNA 2-selenouridine(34) synthase MnmH, partial [Betaproteobacteria bacterium]|nr:tRNA 2-selenouridine(34) synthase MnmH [Betaproteobacteria bacterium]